MCKIELPLARSVRTTCAIPAREAKAAHEREDDGDDRDDAAVAIS
jgi:hypothetical protein